MFVRSLAAAFCTRCSLFVWIVGIPYRIGCRQCMHGRGAAESLLLQRACGKYLVYPLSTPYHSVFRT